MSDSSKIEQSMDCDLPSFPPMPNYAPLSDEIEQSLHKTKKFCKYPTRSESPASSVSSNSNPDFLIPKSSNTLKKMVIFDWDDTLYPTTEFVEELKPISVENMHKWGFKVFNLLNKYIKTFGAENVYIITNGIDGWIQESLQSASQAFQKLNNLRSSLQPSLSNYFSAIDALLHIHRIKTISARTLYEHQFPKQYKQWKEYTFIDNAFNHFKENKKGIILSIGDSVDEWFASKYCTDFLTNFDVDRKFELQRIKLKTTPTLDELMKEWETLMIFANGLKLENRSVDFEHFYSFSVIYHLQMNINRKNKLNINSKTKVYGHKEKVFKSAKTRIMQI